MRIGIDASRAFGDKRTGTENYSFELITRILSLPEAKNHTWILYTRPNQKIEIKNLKLIKNYKLKILNYSSLWTQLGLAWSTWTDGLDVLWIPAHTLPIFARPGLKKIVTIHGIEYEWLPAYENWLQRWYLPLSTQYAVMSASRIIAVSQFTRDQLIKRLGADPDKISVVHEGISYKDTVRESSILNVYGLKRGSYGLFVGTIQPRKNLKRLIEAYNSQGGELKLVICGKLGWNYQDVLDAAKENKNVIVTGYISDEDRNVLLKNALFYVQPSITEGFGLPVLEAMSAGIPVISSNGGALPEVVGDAGLLFDPLDQEDIGHKLSLVIDGHKLRQELIKKGHERIKIFSWNLAAERTYKILTENSKFEIRNSKLTVDTVRN